MKTSKAFAPRRSIGVLLLGLGGIAAIASSMLSCAWPGSGASEPGSITVAIPGSLNASSRAVTADFTAEADSVTITIVDGSNISHEASVEDLENQSSATIDDLYPGACSVRVNAIKAGAVIGSGSSTVRLASKGSVAVSVPISYYQAGMGSFSLEISWPSSAADYASAVIDPDADAISLSATASPSSDGDELQRHLRRREPRLGKPRPGHHPSARAAPGAR